MVRFNPKHMLLSFIAGALVILSPPYFLSFIMDPYQVFFLTAPFVLAIILLSIVILSDSTIWDVLIPLLPTLAFEDTRFFFFAAILGYFLGKQENKQYLTPRLSKVARAMIGPMFMTYFLLQAYMNFDMVSVQIPDQVYQIAMNFASGSFPCDFDQTMDECVNDTATAYIEDSCAGNKQCIVQAMQSFNDIRQNIIDAFKSQLGDFSPTETLGDVLKRNIDKAVYDVLEEIGMEKIKLLLVAMYLAYYRFVVDIVSFIFIPLGSLFLKLLTLTGYYQEVEEKKTAITLVA